MGVRLVHGWIGWGDPHPPRKLTYQVVQVIAAGLSVELQQAGFQQRPQELVGLFFFRFLHRPGRLTACHLYPGRACPAFFAGLVPGPIPVKGPDGPHPGSHSGYNYPNPFRKENSLW